MYDWNFLKFQYSTPNKNTRVKYFIPLLEGTYWFFPDTLGKKSIWLHFDLIPQILSNESLNLYQVAKAQSV